jgi:protein ImuB
MRRVISLFLPHWPIDRCRGNSARSDRPFVFVTSIAGKRVITAANAAAAGEGIVPGMGLADARALRPDLDVGEADFTGNAVALARLARWCDRFSPWTAPYGADGIFLDVTGCAHLFGGEAALVAQLVERLARQGIACRAALADTLGAAWAIARFGGGIVAVVPQGETQKALAGLPVAALRLEAEVAALLLRLGLRSIGELYALPRAALASRCGESVALRLDQALGLAPEPLSPLLPEKRYWSRRSFVEPVATQEAIAAATQELLASLCQRLTEEGVGARKLTLALYRVDGRIEEAMIGTALPSRDARHLWRLFEERLPMLDPGLGVEDMVLTAQVAEKLAPTQFGFSGSIGKDGVGKGATDLAVLVDRLTNRLGTNAVARPAAHESYLPERAIRFLPALHHAGNATWHPGKLRPVRLLPRPEPVEAVAPVPDDPPLFFRWRHMTHRVRRADGPERIANEWWRETSEPRDYYRVEDEDGRRFWLYRAGLYRAEHRPLWFMHGFFG